MEQVDPAPYINIVLSDDKCICEGCGKMDHYVLEAEKKPTPNVRIGNIVSNAKVYGLEESIRRAKFPKITNTDGLSSDLTPGIKSLAQADRGSGHDCWLKGVVVQFDLTFTNKAWVEAERYHWFDIVSSQSTMHRITKFDLDNAYISYVDGRIVDIMKEKVNEYNALCGDHLPASTAELDALDAAKKEKYLEILYSNPAGFKLTAGITTNYLQLKTIYAQRRTHRLPEWRLFCEWIKTLPNSELITGER
jgi:hypothetical protein